VWWVALRSTEIKEGLVVMAEWVKGVSLQVSWCTRVSNLKEWGTGGKSFKSKSGFALTNALVDMWVF